MGRSRNIVFKPSIRVSFALALTLTLTLTLAYTSSGMTHAADNYPTRPLRMVHGFIAGGNVDITARLLATQLTDRLAQQVIVDGRPGAGGTNGAAIVAKAEPDGYTLYLMASGHATSPALYRKLPYEPVKDFSMISMVASNPMVVLTSPAFSAKTVQDLVQLARKAPGKINYGTGGVGSGMHLAAVLFESRAGVKMNHVPYKGGNAGPLALIQGEIPLLFTTPGGASNFVESGRIRALAVTTKKRFSLWPTVPTLAEAGIPSLADFDVLAWYAVAAPGNLPAQRAQQLNEHVRAILQRADIREKFAAFGAEPYSTTSRDAQQFLAAEVARWGKVIRDEKIAPQD